MRTEYLANKQLMAMFGKTTTFTIPSIYYIGLSTSPIGDDGVVKEPSSTKGYKRVKIENTSNNFNVADNKKITNNVQIRFGEPTAEWGEIYGYFLADAQTGGHVLFYENFGEVDGVPISKPVSKNDILTINPKGLTITFE